MRERYYRQLVWFESTILIALAAVWLWVISISSTDHWQTLLTFNQYGEAIIEIGMLLGLVGLGIFGMITVATSHRTRIPAMKSATRRSRESNLSARSNNSGFVPFRDDRETRFAD